MLWFALKARPRHCGTLLRRGGCGRTVSIASTAAAPPATAQRLWPAQREAIEAMLRVDHAGEIGADAIYKGQLAVLRKDPKTGPLIQHMWDQEKRHLVVMNGLLADNRVRPTALLPFWKAAGFALGAATALMGPKAAMACTEAVEEVIGEHYNDQIREMIKMEGVPEVARLQEIIREFRDEELEHKDIAVSHDSKQATAYDPLTFIIKQGCRTAIYIASRI